LGRKSVKKTENVTVKVTKSVADYEAQFWSSLNNLKPIASGSESTTNNERRGFIGAKRGRTQPLLAGFQVRGEALKGCSAGGWRSGRRRSEKGWRRGHFRPLLWVFHACRFPLEQLACHEKKFSGNYELLGVSIDCFSRSEHHTDHAPQ
jgi:hypothetical protein